jgi:riboflavin biosynthesis pyrimidine reductase
VADTLQRLDEHGAPRTAADVVAGLRLHEDLPADGRPRVVAVMISSADGRAAVRGRSGGLGHPADRALLRTLREHVDAVLVGTGTLRAEGYANMLDPDQRERRAAAGRPSLPDVATLTRRLEVPTAIGLFAERDATVRVYTESAGDVLTRGARVVVHRSDTLTLRGVLEHLRAEAGVRSVACEGGPTLLRALAEERCLDDLLLTVAPLLVAGTEVAPLEGPELDPPAVLRLSDVHRSGSHLFLHYAVDGTG